MITPPREPKTTAFETLLKAIQKMADVADEVPHPHVFHLSDIIIRAWSESSARFGLEGFESLHPDSNRVIAELVSKRPTSLRGRGYLVKVRPKTYRLTEAGRKHKFS